MDRDTGGKRRRNKKGRMTSGLAALVWLLCGGCCLLYTSDAADE